MEYLISGFLNVKYALATPTGELLGMIYSYQCLIFTLFLFPVYLTYLFSVPSKRFQNEEFAKEEGMIYHEKVKTSTNLEMAYYMLFIMRRMLYLSLPLWLDDQAL